MIGPKIHCILALLVLTGLTAPCRAQLTIQSLNGDITTTELNNFVTYMDGVTPHTTNLSPGDNALVGWNTSSWNVESIRLMWEATGDVRLMNLMIKFSDPILAHRNDQPLGEHRMMWDGQIEPCWPNYPLPDLGAGCEQGDIIGHLAHNALDILGTPSLLNKTVPDGNPYRYGVTYQQRAMTYINMCDAMTSRYITRWFVTPSTHLFRTPTDPRYEPAGQVTAWNRRMMLVEGYLYLAKCHDLLGDHPSYLATYKAAVKANVDAFVASTYPYDAKGKPVYAWNYTGNCTALGDGEACPFHGEYDAWGLYQAYESGYTNVTAAQMTSFANAVQNVVYIQPDLFTYYVDGEQGGHTVNAMMPFWIYLAEWNRSLYTEIAQADIDAGWATSQPITTASILSMKHWIAKH